MRRPSMMLPILFVILAVCPVAHSVLKPGEFAGQVVNFMCWDLAIGQIQPVVEEWQNITGGRINIVGKGAFEVPGETLTDHKTINYFDMYITLSSWAHPSITGGYLRDITEDVRNTPELQWHDISQYVRDRSSSYLGNVWMLPFDGDVFLGWWRPDLLKSAGLAEPETIQEMIAVAKYFHGKDNNNDSKPDFGVCIDTSSLAPWYFFAILAQHVQTTGSNQGIYFNSNNGSSLVMTEAWTRSLELYREIFTYTKFSLEGIHNDIATTKIDFTMGRCAIAFDFSNLGSWALRPESKVLHNPWSFKASFMFGSREVLNWDTGKLVRCNDVICPYAINGVNRVPFAGASGGLRIMFNKKTKVFPVAWSFAVYLASGAVSDNLVSNVQGSFIDPFRNSHFTNKTIFTSKGMPLDLATQFLDTLKKNFDFPNVADDLRIPGSSELYGFTIPPSALEQARVAIAEKNVSIASAQATLASQWDAITNKYGFIAQRNIYRAYLGLPALSETGPKEKEDLSSVRIGLWVATGVATFNIFVLFVLFFMRRTEKVIKASSVLFCYLMFAGSVIALVGIFLWIPEPTSTLCIGKFVFLHFGFILVFSCLFVKTWRIFMIFRKADDLGSIDLPDLVLCQLLALIMVPESVYLIVFGALSDPKPYETSSGSSSKTQVVCGFANETAWTVLFILIPGVVLLVCLVLAIQTRNVLTDFNESKIIGFMVYALVLEYVVLIPVNFVVRDTPTSALVLPVMTGLIGVIAPMNIMFITKILQSFRGGSGSKTSSNVLSKKTTQNMSAVSGSV